MTTLHTYPDLVGSNARLAAVVWANTGLARSVAATLAHDPQAIILAVYDCNGTRQATGYAPGGIA